jgi:hypothetical protein
MDFAEHKYLSSVEEALHAFGFSRQQNPCAQVVKIEDESLIEDIPGVPIVHEI